MLLVTKETEEILGQWEIDLLVVKTPRQEIN